MCERSVNYEIVFLATEGVQKTDDGRQMTEDGKGKADDRRRTLKSYQKLRLNSVRVNARNRCAPTAATWPIVTRFSYANCMTLQLGQHQQTKANP